MSAQGGQNGVQMKHRALALQRSGARAFGIAGLAILLPCSVQLPAQEAWTLTGTVTTGTMPVPGARVSTVESELTAISDANGRFSLRGVAPAPKSLAVSKLGYRPVTVAVAVGVDGNADVRVELVEEAVQLEPVRVAASPTLPPELAGFEERRARGAGSFFTREEIARMQPVLFTDVLRRVPGIQVQPVAGPYGGGYTVGTGRDGVVPGARLCAMLFYLNGVPFPITRDVPINHFIVPEEIAALEVYSGMSRVPPQFISSGHSARCGVIVVWTYTGAKRHSANPR